MAIVILLHLSGSAFTIYLVVWGGPEKDNKTKIKEAFLAIFIKEKLDIWGDKKTLQKGISLHDTKKMQISAEKYRYFEWMERGGDNGKEYKN